MWPWALREPQTQKVQEFSQKDILIPSMISMLPALGKLFLKMWFLFSFSTYNTVNACSTFCAGIEDCRVSEAGP